jgi:hypothetical protein
MSDSNNPRWGNDLLGRRVLGNGESHLITNISFGEWDLKFVDEDGDECFLNKVKMQQSASWSLTDNWLLTCEGYRNRHG